MRADLAEGDRAGLKQVDEERARHVEEVGGLLAGQFGVLAQHGHRAAGGHVLEDLDEQIGGRGRQLDSFLAVRDGDAEAQGMAAGVAPAGGAGSFDVVAGQRRRSERGGHVVGPRDDCQTIAVAGG